MKTLGGIFKRERGEGEADLTDPATEEEEEEKEEGLFVAVQAAVWCKIRKRLCQVAMGNDV